MKEKKQNISLIEKVQQCKKIVDWFDKIVCPGIRAEYESGASHRSSADDKRTLLELLKFFCK